MDELWASMKQLLGFSRSPTHSFDYNPETNVSLPLIDAVVKGRIDIVRQLLACGADPNAEDWRGHSAFHMSSMGSNPVMLQLLLDSGGNIHVKSEGGHRDGMTALAFAVCGEEKELVRILMAAGATTGPHELSGYGMETYTRISQEMNGATVCDGGVTTDMSTQVIIGLLQVVVFLFVVWWAWASIQ